MLFNVIQFKLSMIKTAFDNKIGAQKHIETF